MNHLELVEISGITRPILSGIENATINPTLETILKVSESLEIEIDLLFINKNRFNSIQKMLKNEYEKAKFDHYELIISEQLWKKLLKLSELKNRRNYRRVIECINEIVNFNYPDHNTIIKKKMIYLATLGYLFQDDGFLSGMQFGIWFAINQFSEF
jgi:transcriptional regulator with XRE-family HTH domain